MNEYPFEEYFFKDYPDGILWKRDKFALPCDGDAEFEFGEWRKFRPSNSQVDYASMFLWYKGVDSTTLENKASIILEACKLGWSRDFECEFSANP